MKYVIVQWNGDTFFFYGAAHFMMYNYQISTLSALAKFQKLVISCFLFKYIKCGG